ncbi:MAG: TROVE domain-containing protein, partial [Candidatus Dormibacteraeota bacterium]|nr:TROVE domain-containing protein [Candidatus Dormibacteraeota bacterium]
MKYVRHVSTRVTPQWERILGSGHVPNSAGGYAFPVDDWVRLDRFLVLGSEGGSYYAGEHQLTRENAEAVLRVIREDGRRAVECIREISHAGRAPRNDPAVFALAMAAKLGDEPTRKAAFEALPDVARTPTHLFQFAEALQAFGGWGRATTRAVAGWYQREDVSQLAYQAVKYPQREGWTHADLLRLSHPKAPSVAHRDLYAWIVDGVMPADGEALRQIKGFEQLQNATAEAEAARLIGEYRLPWETVPTELRSSPEVWAALLPEMPLTAMIRNLATMTRIGLVAPMAEATRRVVEELGDRERIRRARVHPLAILAALKTYEQGHGERGKHTWTPVQEVVDALNEAFYLAFDNVEATGKRWLLGVDVSGSMSTGAVGGVAGMTPRVAAAAMTLVTAATEPRHVIMSFQDRFVPLSISPRERLDDVLRRT